MKKLLIVMIAFATLFVGCNQAGTKSSAVESNDSTVVVVDTTSAVYADSIAVDSVAVDTVK